MNSTALALPSRQSQHSLALQLLYMSVAVTVMYGISYLAVAGGRLVIVGCLFALWIPIATMLFWQARNRRRLVALVHFKDDSPWKKRLEGGIFMFSLRLIVTLPTAICLLVTLCQGIGITGWVGLAICAVAWIFLQAWLERKADANLRDYARLYFVYRITFGIAVFLFLVGVSVAGFWQSVPNLDALSMVQAYEYGRSQALGQGVVLHYLTGLWAGLSGLHYWFAEQLSQQGGSFYLRFAIWALVLIKSAFYVVPAMLMVRGASIICEAATEETIISAQSQKKSYSLYRWAAVPAVVVLAAILWDSAVPTPWSWVTGKNLVLNVQGKSYQLSESQFDSLLDKEIQHLTRKQKSYVNIITSHLNNRIDTVFDKAVNRVPEYADWYYSLLGQGARLWVGTKNIFSDEDEVVKWKKLFPNGGLKGRVKQLSDYLISSYQDAQNGMQADFVTGILKKLQPFQRNPHRKDSDKAVSLHVSDIYANYSIKAMDNHSIVRAAGSAAGSAIITKGIIKVTRNVVTEKAKKFIERRAVAAGTRFAARAIPRSLTAAAACSTFAPGIGTVVCGGVTFVILTVGIDYVSLKVSEYANKNDLQKELVSQLNNIRRNIKKQYKEKLVSMLGNMSDLKQQVIAEVQPASYVAGNQ